MMMMERARESERERESASECERERDVLFRGPLAVCISAAEKAIESERACKQESQRASERARTGESWWSRVGPHELSSQNDCD